MLKRTITLVTVFLVNSFAITSPDSKQEALTSDLLSGLWRNAFESLLEKGGQFTAEQQALIWEALELGTTEAFSPDPDKGQNKPSAAKLMDDLLTRANHLFSPAQIRTLYSQMGILENWLAVAGVGPPPCDCSNGTTPCEPGAICTNLPCVRNGNINRLCFYVH